MLRFLLSKKWKLFFDFKSNWGEILLQFLWLTLLMLAAIITSTLYYAAMNRLVRLDPHSILIGISYCLLIIPIILKVFREFIPYSSLFRNNYPISKKEKAIIDILYSILSETWIYFMIVILSIFLLFNLYTIPQLVIVVIIGVNGILIAENLMISINNRNKYQFIIGLFISIALISLLNNGTQSKYFMLIDCIIFLLLCLAYYIFYPLRRYYESRDDKSVSTRLTSQILKIILKNTRYKYAAMSAIILQIIFAITFAELPRIYTNSIILILISFSFLFANCFNNLWGFFPSLAINMLVAGKKMKDYVFVFMKILLPPMLINILLYVVYFFIYPQLLTWKVIIGFCVLTFLAIAIGIIFSFIKVRIVPNIFSLKAKNTAQNLSAIYILSIVSLILGFSQKSDTLFIFLASIGLIVSIVSFILLFKNQDILINKLKRDILIKYPIHNLA